MRFTSESVLHDIEVALRLLLKAQLHIAGLQRQLDHKDLTDEEIEDLADKYLSVNYKYGEDIYVLGEVEFARAILRKAQEK
jgi:CII-binding regulator of phage lambda lysogenization HflD